MTASPLHQKRLKEDDNRRELRPCENITITNCTLMAGHGGVVIGSEISGSIRNVTISNCVFVGTDRGIRIKARRGRGGVCSKDVRAANLVMDGVTCPIVVNLFYGCGAWGEKKVTDKSAQPVNEGTPRFRRLRYSNITARNIKFAAAYIIGLPEMFVEDIIVENSSFFLDPKTRSRANLRWPPGCRATTAASSFYHRQKRREAHASTHRHQRSTRHRGGDQRREGCTDFRFDCAHDHKCRCDPFRKRA